MKGRTALHDAAESGDVETVKNLLSTTDINATTANVRLLKYVKAQNM